MKLKIFSFSGESFASETVKSVTMMTAIGEITILEDHSPLLTSIRPSTISVLYNNEKGEEVEENFAVGKGIVEVSNDSIKVMADMLVDTDGIDTESAENARKKATELMEKYKNSQDKIDMEKYIEAEDMLLRSIAQLNLSQK